MPGRRLRTTAAVLGMGLAATASAGSFAVNPVRVTLATGHAVGALTVTNKGTEPTVIQLDVLRWSQDEGLDVLEPTRDLLATPPIFTVAPGGSQIIRVGLRGRAPDPQHELSYRLILKEVPPQVRPDASGLLIALHISLPVFVTPVVAAKPVLRWEARRGADGLRLSARNDGSAHVQMASIKLAGADGPPQAVSSYVLPGQRHEWRIQRDVQAASPIHLVAQTDAGEISADVVVTAAP